jgi:hypothetical protein
MWFIVVWRDWHKLTLRIHEVTNRHRVALLDLGSLGVEHVVCSGKRAGSEVLLAQSLDLLLDGGTSLGVVSA